MHPHDVLISIRNRTLCSSCFKSYKYYCPRCYVFSPILSQIPNALPKKITLPNKTIIIKHIREVDGKSTASHAKILADPVEIISFDPSDDTSINLLKNLVASEFCFTVFPGPCAYSLSEAQELQYKLEHSKFFIVFLDGTWSQAKSMYNTLGPKQLICLPDFLKTRFWRYQDYGDHFLSTIEAIYHFWSMWLRNKASIEEKQCLENLLWLYDFQFDQIQSHYRNQTHNLSFTSKHKSNYITI